MSIVTLNSKSFIALYPEMANIADVRLSMWFSQAESIVNNTDCSVVTCLKEREMLLMILMRHIAAIEERAAQGGMVGRIASASEGSVSVSADMGGVSSNAAWYMQTPYGANYWQMTAKYRRFRYVAGGSYARR